MHRTKLTIGTVLALAGLVVASDGQATKDVDLGLSKTSVFDTPAPPAPQVDTSERGERPTLPRAYEGEPPRIPHGISDFGAITREDNPCLMRHTGPPSGEVEEDEPTSIPQSHFVDLRNAPDETREQLVGARHNCTACHVVLTDAAPLVGNRFGKRGDDQSEKP